MSVIASQITTLTIVYSTICSGADQRKHQSSASLAFVRGIHRGPVNSPHKWPVTRKKTFHLMTSSWSCSIPWGCFVSYMTRSMVYQMEKNFVYLIMLVVWGIGNRYLGLFYKKSISLSICANQHQIECMFNSLLGLKQRKYASCSLLALFLGKSTVATRAHTHAHAKEQWPLLWRHNGRDGVSNHQPHDVYSIDRWDADQRKYQSSASLAFVRWIHRGPVNSPHKWPVMRRMFPFDDVIMCRKRFHVVTSS